MKQKLKIKHLPPNNGRNEDEMDDSIEEGDLQSSSDYHARGLLSPRMRNIELRRIISELRTFDDPAEIDAREINGAQDLCFRLYSATVSKLIAKELGTSGENVRKALDKAILWSPNAG